MLRTFSENELDEMCKKRPPEYRADILAITAKKPDGTYELDTGTEVYFKLKNKYAAATLPPAFKAEARQLAQHGAMQVAAKIQAKELLKAVQYEDVYRKANSIVDIVGQSSPFAFAYMTFLDMERRGGCKSCSRRGQLQKLMTGLKISVMGTSPDRKQKVRELFPDSTYFEVVPAPLKWEDLMK